MDKTASPGKRLRVLINAPEILILPGVYDGMSTRLVKHMGFNAAFISTGSVSESRVGSPDVGFIGYEGAVGATRQIAYITDMLIVADADTGYGNALNVFHTVRGFEQTGVAAVMIEDQESPKRGGHYAGKRVISAEEMVQKIRAACDARIDPDLVIKSRTDAIATHGLDDAIRRLNLYGEAGADLVFADAVMSKADIATLAKETVKPLCVNMGFGIQSRPTTPLMSPRELQDLGVAVVIYPRLLPACAMAGMRMGMQVLQETIKSGEVLERRDLIASVEDMLTIMGMPEIREMEQRYGIS